VSQEILQLEDSGFDMDIIRILTNDGAIKKLLGCESNRIVAKYASIGALLGIAGYGVFILVAVWCDCNLYPISQTNAFEIVLVGITAGALIGAIIGVFPGLAQYEKDTHLYTRGINIGDKVLVLHAPREDVEKAEKTSRQIGCRGVRVVPKFYEWL
jgi:hypothetical protein